MCDKFLNLAYGQYKSSDMKHVCLLGLMNETIYSGLWKSWSFIVKPSMNMGSSNIMYKYM